MMVYVMDLMVCVCAFSLMIGMFRSIWNNLSSTIEVLSSEAFKNLPIRDPSLDEPCVDSV